MRLAQSSEKSTVNNKLQRIDNLSECSGFWFFLCLMKTVFTVCMLCLVSCEFVTLIQGVLVVILKTGYGQDRIVE